LFFGKTVDDKNATSVFDRFIRAAITWNWKDEAKSNDFRLKLIYNLQYILFQSLTSIGLHLLDPSLTNTIVSQDLQRALAWTDFLARNVKIKYDEIPDRPTLF
jgi:hypothetical protein